ncbi:MAG: TatD family hydrolase [Prevotellaceae bacterium]|nr:TatD family hydrolase [Prevotellaceae bacterium]
MTDTHSHIYGSEFDEDRDAVVARAKAAGISRIYLPNINRDSIGPMLNLCEQYPGYCLPMMGLHPEDVGDDWQQTLSDMHALLTEQGSPYVAVGEVGLDFYWDASRKTQQTEAFARQVVWAASQGLPLVIHCRSAHRELVDVLRAYKNQPLRGIFHCFSGSLDEAKELLSFEGFALGIGGVLTYKKSRLPDVLRQLPLERMVLETDSPYLAPVPYRGKRNESSYIVATLRFLASVKGLPEPQVEQVTDAVAETVFRTRKEA